MEPTEIKKQHAEIFGLLTDGLLGQALAQLFRASRQSGYIDLRDHVNERLVGYNYLLTYFKQGGEDPMRDEMYDKISEEAFRLNDLLADRLLERADTCSLYYQHRRRLNALLPVDEEGSPLSYLAKQLDGLQQMTTEQTADNAEYRNVIHATIDDLFYAIWTGLIESSEDRKALLRCITRPDITDSQRCLLIAALTLNLLHRFDPVKTEIMVDLVDEGFRSEGSSNYIQRAWVGLGLILTVHADRMQHSRSLTAKLERLGQQQGLKEQGYYPMLSLQMLLYQAFEADRAKQCLADMISPELQRLAELQKNLSNQGKTPHEIELKIGESDIAQYLVEINDMQREGTDIMLDTFEGLCHHPFFHRMPNWLRTFDITLPELQKPIDENEDLRITANLFKAQPQLCDTDRYACFLNFSTMRSPQSRLLVKAMKAQVEAECAINDNRSEKYRAVQASRSYMHDLYRFFTLFTQREELVNPFGHNIHLCCMPQLSKWFDTDARVFFANYLFGKQRYDEAFRVYNTLAREKMDKELMQRYAYCAYVKHNPDEPLAERTLVECNRLYPGDVWTLRFLAQYYVKRMCYAEAISLLDEALLRQPGHYDLLIEMARCLIKNEQYDEALAYLYEAEDQSNKEQDVARVIAWCLVQKQDFEQAETYAQKLMNEGNTSIDWVCAGLVSLSHSDVPTAIERFSGSFATHDAWTADAYIQYFKRIEGDLIRYGFDKHTLTLAREAAYMGAAFKD